MKSIKLIFLMMMLFTVLSGTAQKVFIDDVYFSSGKKDKKQTLNAIFCLTFV